MPNPKAQQLLNYRPIRDPAAVFQQIKQPGTDDSDEDDDGEGDQEPQSPSFAENKDNEQVPSHQALNEKQQQIFDTCDKYFAALYISTLSNSKSPTPLRLLINGPPGCGKSYLTHEIFKKAKSTICKSDAALTLGKQQYSCPKEEPLTIS